MRVESSCNGQSVIIWFQALSGGKISSAPRTASAASVLNSTGAESVGMAASLIRSNRTGSPGDLPSMTDCSSAAGATHAEERRQWMSTIFMV